MQTARDLSDTPALLAFNGQLYGIPYSVENIALFRNTDLVPTAPATIEDMVAAGKQLVTDGKTKEILSLQVGQNGGLETWILGRALGRDLALPDLGAHPVDEAFRAERDDA